jgi:hypothetical protein
MTNEWDRENRKIRHKHKSDNNEPSMKMKSYKIEKHGESNVGFSDGENYLMFVL